ncbi:hypothetical protein F1559_000593 [Cyanidiococcus yangmingshanensis]|uniref:Uncharacterized protein n=1 Tax=Cyanidiococcus yangmingshanensis TaxID=2690220 RepID=A0A7J7IGI6_9RHOD|nr:hypothetical protein F1559_000593 [Cyanidiococcus yangmingshanensis]
MLPEIREEFIHCIKSAICSFFIPQFLLCQVAQGRGLQNSGFLETGRSFTYWHFSEKSWVVFKDTSLDAAHQSCQLADDLNVINRMQRMYLVTQVDNESFPGPLAGTQSSAFVRIVACVAQAKHYLGGNLFDLSFECKTSRPSLSPNSNRCFGHVEACSASFSEVSSCFFRDNARPNWVFGDMST